MQLKAIALAGLLSVAPRLLQGQFDFSVEGRPVQIHSFLSEGFAYSDQNNYLTMNTSRGAFFTDGGVNISGQITDKFRIGAQMYFRNVGHLGQWYPTLDWAVADYRFTSWFGLRGGKVKTTLGLYNDSQDMEFLHPWAILPQSTYPLDLRASTIAHEGGDVYGMIGLQKFGDIAYTVSGGYRPDDPYGGYPMGIAVVGIKANSNAAVQWGGDLRWSNLIHGLVFGGSYLHQRSNDVGGTIAMAPMLSLPLELNYKDNTVAFYTQYRIGKLAFDGEYRRENSLINERIGVFPPVIYYLDERGWYISAAYQVFKRLELGGYYSRFVPLWDQNHDPAFNHIYDPVVAARITVTHFWDFKIEGHFIDGYGSPYSFRGFYPQENPYGFKSTTNMLVLRTGFFF